MRSKLEKAKGRKLSGGFSNKPHHIFRANLNTGTPAPTAVLSNAAFRMLDNLIAQFNGSNNGDLCASPKVMELYGWNSRSAIHDATVELLATGFIEQTRQGGRNSCSLYAVTWLAIDDCNGKLELVRRFQRIQ